MAVRYTKLFRKECEGKFGLTRPIVKDAIAKPDREQRLESQGLTIVMYSKKLKRGDYVIISAHAEKEDLMIDLAFRVKERFVKDAKTDLPFPLMRALAYKLGLPIRVGEQESKFIYNEVIPVSGADIKKAVRIPNPEKHPLISAIWVRMLQNSMGALAQCALVFCIDAKKYRAWLRG
ncbi:MAG: hypothetical protein QXJ74_03715 [Nitrososphaera sp.]